MTYNSKIYNSSGASVIMCKPSDTPKTNAVEYASAKVQPSRMVVDADWARTLEREAAMWKQAAEILADALVKETDCDADESCGCVGCHALVQYEKIKLAAAKRNCDGQQPLPPATC